MNTKWELSGAADNETVSGKVAAVGKRQPLSAAQRRVTGYEGNGTDGQTDQWACSNGKSFPIVEARIDGHRDMAAAYVNN